MTRVTTSKDIQPLEYLPSIQWIKTTVSGHRFKLASGFLTHKRSISTSLLPAELCSEAQKRMLRVMESTTEARTRRLLTKPTRLRVDRSILLPAHPSAE